MAIDIGQIVAGIGKVAPAAVANYQANQADRDRTALQAVDLQQRTQANRAAAEAAAIKDDNESLNKYVEDLAAQETDLMQKVMATNGDPKSLMALHGQTVNALASHVDAINQKYGRKVFSVAEFKDAMEAKIKTALTPEQTGTIQGRQAAAAAAANPNAEPLVGVLDKNGNTIQVPRSKAAGQISAAPKLVEAFDTQTKQPAFVLENEIAKSNGRYTPVPNGMKIESDGKGGFTFTSGAATAASGGPNNAPGVGTTGTGIVDTQVLAATAGLARLERIRDTYKPEMLQTGTKIQAAIAAGREKLGANLNDADKKLLTDLTTFRSDAVQNFNQYIKDQTGTALSPGEADRLGAALPVAGTSVWDGDSPTQFQAKLDETTRQLRYAAARLSYIRQNGLTLKDVPLDSMPELIDKRIKEISDAVEKAQPGIKEDDLAAAVRTQVAREFGLLNNAR